MGPGEVVVLDTNVLISAAGWNGPERRLLSICRAGALQLSISSDLIFELERVMKYPKLGFEQVRAQHFINQLIRHALVVEPERRLDVITADDTDNRVLECALAADATWIISGDKHLLALETFGGIQIVTTAHALRLFDG